ncbi:DUF3592 domain-containing protein [Oxalobacteraceae bacterium CAVE-383]|nr:DUF3592 domain-containing protein [Oxalobacteraceae bacterium CAVE-383]
MGYEPNPKAASVDAAHVLIFMLVLFAAFFIWVDYMTYQASTVVRIPIQWRTEQGTLISKEIGRIRHKSDFVIYAHYSYPINGFQYIETSEVFGPTGRLSEDAARTLSASYPLGPVKVWYDPANPATSKLEEGIPIDWSWSFFNWSTAFAIVFLSFSGWWLYVLHWKPKKSK